MRIRLSARLPVLLLAGIAILTAAPSGAAAAAAKDASAPASGEQWVAPDQTAATERAKQVVPFVDTVVDECLLCRKQKLRDMGLGVKNITHNYFLLDSPIIKKREDHYGPVRFMHTKHAADIQDCAVCHHFRPTDPAAKETVRCSACHQESFRSEHPDRIGLKAAYHQQCVDCHRDMAKGPVDCTGCHLKNVPDHTELVQLAKDPKPWEVTAECLRCHEAAGQDMLASAHWLWKGHSPYTLDHRKKVQHGKATTAVNNF